MGVESSAVAGGEAGPASASSANFALNQASFDYFLCALSRRNCADPELALTASGTVQCWGGNAHRELGLRSADEDPHPTALPVAF